MQIDVIGQLRRLRTRVNNMVARSVVNVVNDALKTQRLQLTIQSDELEDDVEHMQPYGLSFVPPAGSEAIALAVRGDRDHTIALCVQNPDERPTGNPPRTGGLYTDGEWRLFIEQDGTVNAGAQRGESEVALANLTNAEFKRIWDVLTSSGVVPAPSTLAGDAGEPGLLTMQQLASTAAAQVQSVAARNVRAT
jgi:phage baseplate assembly protein V